MGGGGGGGGKDGEGLEVRDMRERGNLAVLGKTFH